MNRRSIKLIKQHERVPLRRTPVATASPNRWSTAVRSWVIDFRQRDRRESTPAFDSLFKDALPESERTG